MLFICAAAFCPPAVDSKRQLSRDVARKHVDFNVHMQSGSKISKERAAKRVRDEHDFKENRWRAFGKTILDLVDGQTDTIDANRTFFDEIRGQVAIDVHLETHGIPAGRQVDDTSDAIDMTKDDVATHATTERRGSLEMHAGSRRKIAKRRASKRFGRYVGLEAGHDDAIDGQAHAIDGDGFAKVEFAEGCIELRASDRRTGPVPKLADGLDESCEHGKWRQTATCRQRGVLQQRANGR